MSGITFPMPLAAAAALAPEQWDDLGMDDLIVSDADRARVAAAWLWLRGLDLGGPADEVAEALRETATDGGLVVALSLPAFEFFRWFRAADWECFNATARMGSEAWAWAVLQRAWGACEALGAMALQCSMADAKGVAR